MVLIFESKKYFSSPERKYFQVTIKKINNIPQIKIIFRKRLLIRNGMSRQKEQQNGSNNTVSDFEGYMGEVNLLIYWPAGR